MGEGEGEGEGEGGTIYIFAEIWFYVEKFIN